MKFIALLLVLVAGCGKIHFQETTWPTIKKGAVYQDGGAETTPIVFNGELLTVTFWRSDTQGTEIRINRLADHSLVARHPFTQAFGSALVVNATLYVFGSSDPAQAGNAVSMSSTADLVTWTEPVLVLQANHNQRIWNTSVAQGAAGYVMAYEVQEPAVQGFAVRFVSSSDLVNWTMAGGLFAPYGYQACPTIRYENGQYLLLFLRDLDVEFATFGARSTDLVAWELNSNALFAPSVDEAINNSDVDLVEHDGMTIFIYSDGDQTTFSHMHLATYSGALAQLFAEIFGS